MTYFNNAKDKAIESYYPKKKERKTKSKNKMSKKKIDPGKKLLITAIKKTVNKNTVLPILESVLLTGKEAIVTDLETSVVIPFRQTGLGKKGAVAVPNDKFIDLLEMMEKPEVKCDKDFGVTFKDGNRTIKVTGENPDNFPLIPLLDQEYPVIGQLTQEDMDMVEVALCFVSNDDLRPAMTGVLMGERVVSTDAHRMFWKPLSQPITREFILPARSARILLAMGPGEWTVTAKEEYRMEKNEEGKEVMAMVRPTKTVMQPPVHFVLDEVAYRGELIDAETDYKNRNDLPALDPIPEDHKQAFTDFIAYKYRNQVIEDPTEEEEVEVPDMEKEPAPVLLGLTNVCFTRKSDGVKVIARIIDARFPDYKVVLPTTESNVKLFLNPDFALQELKNAGKFANRSTHMVKIGLNGKLSFSSQDVDFGDEYKSEFENNGLVEFYFSPDMPKTYTLDGKPVQIVEDHGAVIKIKNPQGAEVEVMKETLQEVPPSLYIGFNQRFLSEIIHKNTDQPVKIELWSPTKCAIINEQFLLMPLMMND